MIFLFPLTRESREYLVISDTATILNTHTHRDTQCKTRIKNHGVFNGQSQTHIHTIKTNTTLNTPTQLGGRGRGGEGRGAII